MKWYLIAGLCLLLLIAGCRGGFRTGDRPIDIDVHKGNDGITVEFLEQSPPKETFPESPFSVSYEISNEGASDVEGGVISIGIEDDFVTLEGDRIRIFDIEGRSVFNPVGDQQIQTVQMRTKSLPPQTEVVTTSISLNVCHPYKTDAELEMCVDTDVFGRITTKACEAKNVRLSGGQGGPVAVTRIEPTYGPHADQTRVRASFVIYVKNIGDGQVYQAGKSLEACSPLALGPDSWNVATARVFLGDQLLDCTPKQSGFGGQDGYLQLGKKEDFIRCEVVDGLSKIAGTYVTSMTVEIDYGYTYTLTKQMQIKRLV